MLCRCIDEVTRQRDFETSYIDFVTSFAGLSASRFFLGLFEAGCLPLLGLITAQFYRRSEQPVRIAAWNGVTNGLATILSAIVAFGL